MTDEEKAIEIEDEDHEVDAEQWLKQIDRVQRETQERADATPDA